MVVDDTELDETLWRVRWRVHSGSEEPRPDSVVRGMLDVWARTDEHAIDVARATLADRVHGNELLLIGQPREVWQ